MILVGTSRSYVLDAAARRPYLLRLENHAICGKLRASSFHQCNKTKITCSESLAM